MLTSQELARARRDAAQTLVDTAIIKRESVTNNNGINESSFGAVGTVSCRLDPIPMNKSSELYSGEREAAREYFMLTLPDDADIIDGDKVTISAEDYEVMVLHRQHSFRLMVRATVYRVQE